MKKFLRHYLTWLTAGLALTNVLVLAKLDLWHAGPAFVGAYMLIVPGLLLLSFLTRKKLPLPLGITLSVALSIALLMAAGLLVNTMLPVWPGVKAPLTLRVLLPAFDVLVAGLIAGRWRRPRPLPLEKPAFGNWDWAVLFCALLMPALAVLGATSLNNGGSNAFTMASLGVIAGYLPLLFVLKKRLHVAVLPIVLYMMALALLLMNSMRGWFITGHDVLREYYVFRLTNDAGIWNMGAFRDPYNACLSITILPTYLQHFLHIDSAYIYKFVFQLIGALPVIPIFYLFVRYTSSATAFLASFTYISFPAFMVDMSMLNRQSVGFLFFSLLLYILLTNYYVVKKQRTVLLLLLGAGLVVSHYSTAYVTVTLLVMGYVLNLAVRWVFGYRRANKLHKLLRIRKLPNRAVYRRPLLLGWPLVLGVCVMTFVWNGPVTQTSRGITTTIRQIAISIQKPFKQDAGGTVKYGLVTGGQQTDSDRFMRFTQEGIQEERTPSNESDLFPLKVAQAPSYNAHAVSEPAIPSGHAGTTVSRWLHIGLGPLYEATKQGYAKLLQVLLIVGLAALLLGYGFKKKTASLPAEYLALATAAMLLIIFQTVIPQNAIDYGLLRLFQQNLMLLALPITVGFLVLSRIVLRKPAVQLGLYAALMVLFFTVLSGFLPQLTGGGRPALALNNTGFYYDAYYTTAQEMAAFQWLSGVATPRYTLQSDRYFTALKLHAYTGLDATGNRLLPVTAKRDSFVLLGTTTVTRGQVIEYQDGEILYYTLPLNFFNDDKDQVYSTSGSAIYW